jgi:hypothetical protein
MTAGAAPAGPVTAGVAAAGISAVELAVFGTHPPRKVTEQPGPALEHAPSAAAVPKVKHATIIDGFTKPPISRCQASARALAS